jgi:hypothetical protein
LGIGIGYTRKGCTLPHGKKGLKAIEGKSSWQELKSNFETFDMIHPGIPRENSENILSKKRDPTR